MSLLNRMYLSIPCIVVAVLVLASCGSSNSIDTTTPGIMPELGSPATLSAQLGTTPRTTSLAGCEYSDSLPNNRTATLNNTGVFAPDWVQAEGATAADLAYAVYAFDGADLTGSQPLSSIWVDYPGADEYWVGLGNQDDQCWEWRSGPTGDPLIIPDIAPYKDTNDVILVAVVLTGTESVGLTCLALGSETPVITGAYSEFTAPLPGGGGNSDIVLVDGAPAFLLMQDRGDFYSDLYYYRAADADAEEWETPVLLAEGINGYPALAVIDGNPAVAYGRSTNNRMEYRRATDAQGTTWADAVIVHPASGAGNVCNLMVVDGNPAIGHVSDGGSSDEDRIYYVRASDAQGSAWNTEVILDPSYTDDVQAKICSMAIINGNPAMLYSFSDYTGGTKGIRYVYSNNAQGSIWGSPVEIHSMAESLLGDIRKLNLLDLDGVPGAGWFFEDYSAGSGTASIRVGQNAAGSTWYDKADISAGDGNSMMFAAFKAIPRGDVATAVLCVTAEADGDGNSLGIMHSTNHVVGNDLDWSSAKSMAISIPDNSGTSSVSSARLVSKNSSCFCSFDDTAFAFILIVVNLLKNLVSPSHVPSDVGTDEVHVMRGYGLSTGYNLDTGETQAAVIIVDLPTDAF